jgi:hypothetical protein
MTIKNDLTDIGYLLITPNPKKFRFEGVNYQRAGIQLIVGSLASQLLLVGGVIFGPLIIEKLDDVKENVKKKLKK